MKIIAKGERCYIAKITFGEVVLLAEGQTVRPPNGGTATVSWRNESDLLSGTTFAIDKAYQQLRYNETRKDEIASVRKTLMGIIGQLELLEAFIEEPKTEKTETAEAQ
jgi:hypothetical protein